ncbi:MAG: restriction endonuclease subunit S, partial [Bacteroidota bacterium]
HKVVLARAGGITSSDTVVIRASDSAYQPLLTLLVSSDFFIATATQTMNEGSKMPRANWKHLLTFEVGLPPVSLLRSFNEHISPILEQLGLLADQIEKLKQARDLLLPRLMSGEVAV